MTRDEYVKLHRDHIIEAVGSRNPDFAHEGVTEAVAQALAELGVKNEEQDRRLAELEGAVAALAQRLAGDEGTKQLPAADGGG